VGTIEQVYCDMFHEMFVCESGLGREQGTKSVTLAPQDPQQVYIGSVRGTIRRIYVYWIGGVQEYIRQPGGTPVLPSLPVQHHTSQEAAGLSILSPNF
jgi:hypothetical protein